MRNLSVAENERARWWRENVVKLTRAELAPLVGFSAGRIADIETGHARGSPFPPISAETWQRYRLACAAVTLGAVFDWETCNLRLRGGGFLSIGAEENPSCQLLESAGENHASSAQKRS